MGHETASDDTADMLWRRGTGLIGSGVTYGPSTRITETALVVKRLDGLAGIGIVLYMDRVEHLVFAGPTPRPASLCQRLCGCRYQETRWH